MDKICRFCNNDSRISSEIIIACQCKPIHRKCLDKLRCESNNPDSLTICDKCETFYQIELIKEKTICYKTKFLFAFYILRDISLIFIILLGALLACAYFSFQLFDPIKSNALFPTFFAILLTILFTIILLFMLFGFYLLISYFFLCICRSKKQKPYWLDLFLNFNDYGGLFRRIFDDYGNCNGNCNANPNKGDDDTCALILLCALCCWCLVIVEFVRNLIWVFCTHFKNLYKNSHYHSYRVKNLERMDYACNS